MNNIMKKILLIGISAFMVLAGQSKSLVDVYQESTLWNPGEHVFNDIKIVDEGGYFSVTMDPQLSIVVEEYNAEASVSAKCLSGQKIQMCAGGICEIGTEVTKIVPMVPGVKVPLMLEYMGSFDTKEEIPTDVKIELQVNENLTNCIDVYTILMNSAEGSVKVLKGSDGVYFDGKVLNYSVPQNGKITIYDINGRSVMSVAVDGNGTIDLSGLAKGIYSYVVNAGSRVTGKIIL